MNQKQFIYHVNVNANLIVENVTQVKSEIMIIVEVSVVYKSKKKHHACEKDCIWISATCSCESGRSVGSIIADSVITCDDYFLISRALLIATSIHCYLIKKTFIAILHHK